MTRERRMVLAKRIHELAQGWGGVVVAERVLEVAADPDDVLHGFLSEEDWDDAKAGHQHRLNKIRRLIRMVKYTEVVTAEGFTPPKYLEVMLPAVKAKAFVPIDNVATNKELSRQAFNNELKLVRNALMRARSVAEVLGLASELESAFQWLAGIEEKAA